MKTKVLLLALLSGFVFSVSAQEFKPQVGFSNEAGYKTNFKKNKAGDNWFISIAGGASVLFGDQNSEADFKNRLNFAPQFSVGKWFNPYLALRLQLNGGVLHGFETLCVTKTYPRNQTKHFLFVVRSPEISHIPQQISMSSCIFIVLHKCSTCVFKNSDDNRGIARTESPTVNFGILTAFRLSKRVDLNVEVQGSLLNEQFNRVSMYHLTDGIGQLSAGLTFKLGKTDFEVLEPMDYALLNDLNGQINALRAENDELSKRPVSCPECEEVVTNVVNNYVDNVVYFRINSAKIDKNQQVSIFNTAQFMKENNVPIKVIGYADKKTGTGSYNMQLSEKRARAVAKELIDKYGISSSQITIEWKGSDVQPYNENNWNRVVIMSANN